MAHPIWASAQTALGHPLADSITIDRGVASVLALGRYLMLVAMLLFVCAAVSVDRQRAESVLFALVGATGLIAVLVAAHDLLGLRFLDNLSTAETRAQAIDCIALGAILSAAAGIRTLERYETRQSSPTRSRTTLIRTFVVCLAALAICALTLALSADRGVAVAAAFGVATLLAVVAVRRTGLGSWGVWGFSALGLGAALLLVINEPGLQTNSWSLAFASAPAPLTSLSQRIIGDTAWSGTGAGTFAGIVPIYRDFGDTARYTVAATGAATLSIELGRPVLILILAATGAAIALLLLAALVRGRDSFYPAAGAATAITLLILMFVNAGMLGMGAAMIAAAAFGLALAQSRSRTVHP